jgi:uncharacterized protein YyaL (SSP411 family)
MTNALTTLPGAAPFSAELQARLQRAYQEKDGTYSPRTIHRSEDGTPVYTNRLILEVSPYLLQHAHNPVNWHSWGDEAFRAARDTGKLIFLSIGYSTCHWCHVMEEESLDDLEVAEVLNEHFVPIKVDREERPDIDNIFMSVCQATTGSGGWPLTVIMTSDQKPVFAGTYFPKTARFGRAGLMEILPGITEAWRTRPKEFERLSERIVSALKEMEFRRTGGDGLSIEAIETAYSQLASNFDSYRGGFGQAPKFPTPHNVTFLLRYWRRSGDAAALEMAEKTLGAIRLGGVYDHVGFGFHRYSTDADWFVPHFEKMLYDQALLAIAYTESYQATSNEEYARTAQEIFTYVLRDLTSPEGAFYTAEDADSEGEEGKFYLWKTKEIVEILGDEEGGRFIEIYNLHEDGNFSGEMAGLNIPHLKKSLDELAGERGMPPDVLKKTIEESRRALFEARKARIHPLKDDKVLTAWNGLMISALARGSQVFAEESYGSASKGAADFILDRLTDDQGGLIRRYRQGVASQPAHLNDYAFFVQGLIDLYEAIFEVRYLGEAIRLTDRMLELFRDKRDGGLFFTAENGEELLLRQKEIYDGAIPSGNSIAALNLLRLWRITGRPDLGEAAREILKAFSGQVTAFPSGYTQLIQALDFSIGPSLEVVIAGKPEAEDTRNMVRALRREFVPNKVVLLRPPGEGNGITTIARFTNNQTGIDDRATAYVCQDYACRTPTTDIEEMLSNLGMQERIP